MRERKDRTINEMLQDEVMRVRIKEKSKKTRENIFDGQTDKASKVYPHPDMASRSQSAPKQLQQLSASMENPVVRHKDEAVQTSPMNYSPAPVKKQAPQPQEPSGAFKKKKPAWALTAEEHAAEQMDEVDDILNFMDKFDASQFAEDVQVRELLSSLEKRVGELKKEDNWKENWEKRLKERRKKKEEEYLKEKASKAVDDDMIVMNGYTNSQIGINGGSIGSRGEARTVMSERTQESIRSIKEKLEAQTQGKGDWNQSISDKSNNAKFEERLAKHIADEMLRNNPALARIHSNVSVRRIIEQELQKQIKETSNVYTQSK